MVAALLVAPLAPLLGGVALIAADRSRLRIATAAAYGIALALAVVALAAALLSVWKRPAIDHSWVPAIGMRLHLAIDGISAPLVVLTAAIGVLVVLHAGWKEPSATYLGALLMVTGGALATFLVQDAIAFFLAFELVLVPMWLLIARFGDTTRPGERDRAATMFVLYTVLGSTLMLVGILVLVVSAGTSDLTRLQTAHLAGSTQTVVAALLMIGIGIKIPIWPLHSWLPAAHTAAPTGGSVLLAAVLLKMGTYAVVRLVVFPLPGGLHTVAPFVAVFAVIGILVGGLVCLVERSLKRLIAWSSVAHMGFVVLALMTGTTLGVQAALYGNIAHGVISALLFVVVGGLKKRWGGDDLQTARHALRQVSPRLGLALVVGFAGSLALPGLAGFWGEILTLFSAWSPGDRPLTLFRILAVAAATGSVLAAAYALRVLRGVWAGTGSLPYDGDVVADDAHSVEWVVIALLVAGVVALGVWPIPVMHQTAYGLAHVSRVLVGGAP
ncbi:NADH-quinone oxidoreductase subunit M [Allobranchiibius sp. GilTou38]|uniref:NADH-quinone oxidoreductase subunit M n=1 Tax=Allobranchiibius sp. GilTou38 TaxID=2815210 RepID=UPI001AA12816|nr:NADH-quinone oxidoreductase subunit M [Allobranchiibius sp. GilTou38]